MHPTPRLTLQQMTFPALNRHMGFWGKRWAANSKQKHVPPLRHSLVRSLCPDNFSSRASSPRM